VLGFNYKKAVQTLNFFARKEGSNINKMKALKLIWLSDRLHLRKFGRRITNDTYFALNYGPVPSNSKDLAENTSFLSQEEQCYRDCFLRNEDSYTYFSVEELDKNVFSESDLDVLQSIYTQFGSYDHYQLSDISHKYPEWKKFELHLKSKDASRFEMSYLDFFENPTSGDPCLFQEEEMLILAKEVYLENENIYNLV